jgi:hypothetical protein
MPQVRRLISGRTNRLVRVGSPPERPVTSRIPISEKRETSQWAFSSAGRALPLQGRGRRFEPVNAHRKAPVSVDSWSRGGRSVNLGPRLVRATGPIGAAIILGSVGDIARFPTAGHFASYNATAPIEASSGVKRRHRLNPRGNRKLNHALHIAAVCQLRYPGEGRDYYQKKIAQGKTSKGSNPSAETAHLQPGLTASAGRHHTASAEQMAGPGGHPGTTLNTSVAG